MLRTISLLTCAFTIFVCPPAFADDSSAKKNQGPPPMLVEIATVTQGESEPRVERIGTIRYKRVSRVASEMGGLVEKVYFSEGDFVQSGTPLIQLRNDLLKKSLESTEASYEQISVELEHARKTLTRIKALFTEKSVSEMVYDESYYAVIGLEKRAKTMKANYEKQLLELGKTTITAPFSGLIQSKSTEQGEWISTSGQIALIADNRELEVSVDVPQQQLSYLKKGQAMTVRCAGQVYSGEFAYIVPRGDISTRTFNIRLTLKNASTLIEGMEAYVQLPNGLKQQSLLVPRDAVIKQFGQNVVFIAKDGKSMMIPVQVSGYQEELAAVSGSGLSKSMQVVVKGNERIRDGQAIRFNQ